MNEIYKSKASQRQVGAMYDQLLAQFPIPIESVMLTSPYGPTHVLTHDQPGKPALVIFHGWGASAATLAVEYDLARLARSFSLVMPDIIGQWGRSAPARPSMKGDAYARWVESILDGLELEQAYLLGISGGGFLALKTAAYLSPRMKGVVAVSPGGILSTFPPGFAFIRGLMPVMMLRGEARAKGFVQAMKAPSTPWNHWHEAMAEMMKTLFQHYHFDSGPVALTDDELRRIKTPLRFLLGEKDIIFPPSRLQQRIERLLPDATIDRLAEAGHVLNYDAPGMAETALEQLLSQHIQIAKST